MPIDVMCMLIFVLFMGVYWSYPVSIFRLWFKKRCFYWNKIAIKGYQNNCWTLNEGKYIWNLQKIFQRCQNVAVGIFLFCIRSLMIKKIPGYKEITHIICGVEYLNLDGGVVDNIAYPRNCKSFSYKYNFTTAKE